MSMATDTRFFDVWIVERNTVYQKVPFTVVADWLQEGRLIETDRVRPSGTTVWQKLAEHPLLLAYLPRAETGHAEDAAEALKEVELDFPGQPKEPDDDDVDMIPLIDVSLVLLVFFMMTAQNLMTSSPVKNPEARRAETANPKGVLNIGMMAPTAAIEYYVGDSYKPEEMLRTPDQVVEKVKVQLKLNPRLKVILQCDRQINYDKVQELTIKLEKAGVGKLQVKVKHVGERGNPQGEAAP
jgi:biopolymer transport protein ExbD